MKLTEQQLMELKPLADALEIAAISGGYAHVVWEDGNFEKCFIESALKSADGSEYPEDEFSKKEAVALLTALKSLTYHQRKQFHTWWNKIHIQEQSEKLAIRDMTRPLLLFLPTPLYIVSAKSPSPN